MKIMMIKKMKKATTKRNKKKLPPPSQLTSSIHSLPDDLLLTCLARISRLYYPTLSLVSKTFRSLLASPELHKTRSSFGFTESFLYVSFRSNHRNDTNLRWFTLSMNPGKKKSSGRYVLVPTSVPHSAPAQWSGYLYTHAEKGYYYIGGPVESMSSSGSQATPQFWVETLKPHINIYDRKVYVTTFKQDGCTFEVFDEISQKWVEISHDDDGITSMDQNVYMFGSPNPLVYKPKKGQWEMFWGWRMHVEWFAFGVIGNVLFRFHDGLLSWYDSEVGCWEWLKGLEGFPKFKSYDQVRLVDYGGKIVVLWEDSMSTPIDCEYKMIWCAVIALEKHSGEDFEIFGKLEWCDMVLTIPAKSFTFEYAFAATV